MPVLTKDVAPQHRDSSMRVSQCDFDIFSGLCPTGLPMRTRVPVAATHRWGPMLQIPRKRGILAAEAVRNSGQDCPRNQSC